MLEKVSFYSVLSADSSVWQDERTHTVISTQQPGHLLAGVFSLLGKKHTSIMACKAAAATATEQPEGQVFPSPLR